MSEPTEYETTTGHGIFPPGTTIFAPNTRPVLPRLLLKKLLTIGGEIGHVGKDSRNQHDKYDYASEKAIKEAVYPLLRKHGVFFSLEVQGLPFEMGSAFVVPFRYRFIDVETGEEFSGQWLGTGLNRGDKGLYIAITGAIKYALTTHCGIVTGDDSEADDDGPTTFPHADPPRPKPPTEPSTFDPTYDPRVPGTCDNCGEATPPDVRTIPSKYENFKSMLKVGDPVYRCEECGKWVPAR